MEVLSQGSIITGIRNKKYEGIECNGIVITARCDLVPGREKVDKVYFLIALELKDWLLSDIGWKTIVKNKVNSVRRLLSEKLRGFSLDWDTISDYSIDEFQTVICDTENCIPGSDQKELQKSFKEYLSYLHPSTKEKIDYYCKNNSYLKEALSFLFNGNDTHFSFISSKSYGNFSESFPGLIVDHQELFFFSFDLAKAIEKNEIDEKNNQLSSEKIEEYNDLFYLRDGTGFSTILHRIQSPWIEYLTQRFSSTFARIGVDNPDKQDVIKIVDRIIKEWGEKR